MIVVVVVVIVVVVEVVMVVMKVRMKVCIQSIIVNDKMKVTTRSMLCQS